MKNIDWLKKEIQEKAFISKKENAGLYKGFETDFNWLLDVRNIVLQPSFLEVVAEVFWEKYNDFSKCQIGGIETSSIPLITAVVTAGYRRGKKVQGFYIRKSRKKQGMRRQIEGELNDAPIILVDDLINSGKSFQRQLEALAQVNKTVESIFTLVRFRPLSDYQNLFAQVKEIKSLFTLEDFSIPLITTKNPAISFFSRVAYFKSTAADHTTVLPKSPLLYNGDHFYFGSDHGHLWCLQKDTLNVVWHQKLGVFAKHNFYAPLLLHGNSLVAASHRGIVYVLDKLSGKLQDRFSCGSQISSAPLSLDNNHIVIAAKEANHGVITLINTQSGKQIWSTNVSDPILASGVIHEDHFYFIDDSGNIVMGNKDKIVGTFSGVKGSVRGGIFLDHHSQNNHTLFWCTMNGKVCRAPVSTLKATVLFQADAGFWNTPYNTYEKMICASLDHNVYCVDKNSGKIDWQYIARGRIFASPIVSERYVFIGTNEGRFYALDIQSGKELGYYQASERVLFPGIAYEEKKVAFTTFDNEIYLLSFNGSGQS